MEEIILPSGEKVIIPKTNDIIANVDCKQIPKCCENARWINQVGSDYCMCMNCHMRCRKCKGDYLNP